MKKKHFLILKIEEYLIFFTCLQTANDSMTSVSIIIPTYKERNNLTPLVTRLYNAVPKTTQVLIIDDNSNDGSIDVINSLSKTYPNLKLITRTSDRGLSSAVLHGFDIANGDVLVCMDADLQHPPEQVPSLIHSLENCQFAIGTRYASSQSIDKNWPLYRRVISTFARLLARPLTPLSDPMTGFFAVKKQVYNNCKTYNKTGFKICLEIYVKAGVVSHAEVPIVFGVRTEGESKLSGKVVIGYVLHLLDLYLYSMPGVLIAVGLFVLFVVWLLLKGLY